LSSASPVTITEEGSQHTHDGTSITHCKAVNHTCPGGNGKCQGRRAIENKNTPRNLRGVTFCTCIRRVRFNRCESHDEALPLASPSMVQSKASVHHRCGGSKQAERVFQTEEKQKRTCCISATSAFSILSRLCWECFSNRGGFVANLQHVGVWGCYLRSRGTL
jgi:hypothetical protein